jgi:hypothetical protein
LSEVTNLDSWADVKNQYARNVILPATVEPLNKNVKANFNSALLNNVIVAKKGTEQNSNNIAIDAYINKPGLLANGLQYVSLLNPSFNGNAAWYNKDNRHNDRGYGYDPKNISELRISGCVFARDLKSTWSYNLTKEGHIRPVEKPITYQDGYAYYPGGCSSTLAPSLSDPNVIYFDPVQTGKNEIDDFNNGALLGAHITHYDFTHAEFGEYVDGMDEAIDIVRNADIFVVVGTSLQVYPAANFIHYAHHLIPKFVIDPGEMDQCEELEFTHFKTTATEGMKKLLEAFKEL